MDDAAPITSPDGSFADCNSHSHEKAIVSALKLVAGLVGAMGLWWAVWAALGGNISANSWAWHLFMPTAILALSCLMIFREARHWWSQGRKMELLLPQIRAGECPIEALAEVGGGLAKIVPLVQELLRDLREQRQAVAHLEQETRLRVASRTSALERQLGSMKLQAMRDPLTGLYNRRMLDTCLPKMVANCRGEGHDLAVLAIDVDNFKTLNDSLGHAAGDELLRSIGQVLRSGIREGDAAIRCGGDEFVLLLPGCPEQVAMQLGARLTATVALLSKPLKTPRPPGLSVGFASLRHLPQDLGVEDASQLLLEAADKNLYLVKSARKTARPAGGIPPSRAAVA